MIIFDLSTLADDSHRRHFIDPYKNLIGGYDQADFKPGWKPDWQAYYDDIDKDKPILPVFEIFNTIRQYDDVQVWSENFLSLKEKTIDWFLYKVPIRPTYWNKDSWNHVLKMRPEGNIQPYYKLKEEWMFERCKIDDSFHPPGIKFNPGIEMVFDSDPDSIEMWRKNGIFCFDCRQNI